MLYPKELKLKKMQRGRLKGKAYRNNKLFYGNFGIQALEPIWLTSRQIEAARRTISYSIKHTGKLWIKIFPNKSITIRVKESRMGCGKGSICDWVAVIKPGNILFEINNISNKIAIQALTLACYKLPLKTQILKN